MQSSRKLKAASAFSMAIIATLSARDAGGATLTSYYDNITEFDPSGNVVQSYSYATSGGNYLNIPNTIHIAVGDTFSLGIDAVVTNNINPHGGLKTGTKGHT